MPVIHVKSMPGTLVAMPPSLIGSPVASTNFEKSSNSSGQFARMSRMRYFTISSARSILPFKSQNAISGSIIQNSFACREVFEFSARKVGPNV